MKKITENSKYYHTWCLQAKMSRTHTTICKEKSRTKQSTFLWNSFFNKKVDFMEGFFRFLKAVGKASLNLIHHQWQKEKIRTSNDLFQHIYSFKRSPGKIHQGPGSEPGSWEGNLKDVLQSTAKSTGGDSEETQPRNQTSGKQQVSKGLCSLVQRPFLLYCRKTLWFGVKVILGL